MSAGNGRLHDCIDQPSVEVPDGRLWRCGCGQLWQLSVARGAWVRVGPAEEGVFRGLFGDQVP